MIVKDALRSYKHIQGLFTQDVGVRREDLPKEINGVKVETLNPVEFPDESLQTRIQMVAKETVHSPVQFDKNLGTKINILVQ
jgi:hypothetical protein